MRRIFFVAALAAAGCGATAGPLPPDADLMPADSALTGSCPELAAGDAECCVLACTDAEAFRERCSPPPGECLEYACRLADGQYIRPGICTPVDPCSLDAQGVCVDDVTGGPCPWRPSSMGPDGCGRASDAGVGP